MKHFRLKGVLKVNYRNHEEGSLEILVKGQLVYTAKLF